MVLKAGVIYDTHDNEPNSMKGSWNEFLFFRVAMNQNFIIALDYGKAWSSEDGATRLYINLGYLF